MNKIVKSESRTGVETTKRSFFSTPRKNDIVRVSWKAPLIAGLILISAVSCTHKGDETKSAARTQDTGTIQQKTVPQASMPLSNSDRAMEEAKDIFKTKGIDASAEDIEKVSRMLRKYEKHPVVASHIVDWLKYTLLSDYCGKEQGREIILNATDVLMQNSVSRCILRHERPQAIKDMVYTIGWIFEEAPNKRIISDAAKCISRFYENTEMAKHIGVALKFTLTGIKYESTFAAVTRCISKFEGHLELAETIARWIAYTAQDTRSDEAVSDMSECIARYWRSPEAAESIAHGMFNLYSKGARTEESVAKLRSAAGLIARYDESPEAAILILNSIRCVDARAFKARVDIFSDKEISGFILGFDEEPRAARHLTGKILEILDEGGRKEDLLGAVSKANASGKYRLVAGIHEFIKIQHRLKGIS